MLAVRNAVKRCALHGWSTRSNPVKHKKYAAAKPRSGGAADHLPPFKMCGIARRKVEKVKEFVGILCKQSVTAKVFLVGTRTLKISYESSFVCPLQLLSNYRARPRGLESNSSSKVRVRVIQEAICRLYA